MCLSSKPTGLLQYSRAFRGGRKTLLVIGGCGCFALTGQGIIVGWLTAKILTRLRAGCLELQSFSCTVQLTGLLACST